MTSGIYLITNKINGKMYIGGSINIEKRFKEHIKGGGIREQIIDKAIHKYGAENFSLHIIEELPPDWKIIGPREIYWIEFYNTFKDRNHYNLTEGGEGISGWKHTKETRKKISKNNVRVWLGVTLSEEEKKRHSECLAVHLNTTGFYRVSKFEDERYSQGYVWRYRYYQDNKRKMIKAVNFFDLKKKVELKGLVWKIVDINKAIKTVRELYGYCSFRLRYK